jgi:hypothetical protein
MNFILGKIFDLLIRIGIDREMKYDIVKHFKDPQYVTHKDPVNLNASHVADFNNWRFVKTLPVDLMLVSNPTLTSDGVVIKSHRTMIRALSLPVYRFRYGLLYNIHVRWAYKKLPVRAQKYLLVFDSWSCVNYYHWTVDSLCRIQVLYDAGLLSDFTLVLPESARSFVWESLKAYDVQKVMWIPSRSMIRPSSLYVMSFAAHTGQQDPEVLARVAAFMRKNLYEPELCGDKIYVSRKKSLFRKIVNEDEVIDVLMKYGFKVVYFEDMPFEKQVSLMRGTRFFVSSHGANLTNMIYMEAGASVLEMVRERNPNLCMWSTADSMNLNYYYQFCKESDNGDIFVKCNELEHLLDLMLSNAANNLNS